MTVQKQKSHKGKHTCFNRSSALSQAKDEEDGEGEGAMMELTDDVGVGGGVGAGEIEGDRLWLGVPGVEGGGVIVMGRSGDIRDA
jgi:hypothetical protein